MRRQCLLVYFCLLGLLLFKAENAPAQTDSAARSLKGLTGVMIRVDISDQLKKDGLIIGQVVDDIEMALEEVGLEVLSSKKWHRTEGRPYLRVQIDSTKIQDNWKFYTYSIHIHLIQDVYLARAEQTDAVTAATWFKAVSGHGYLGDIRIRVKEVVGQFTQDYQSGQRP